MNVNMIVSATAVLVGLMVGLVFYLQSQSDDASYLVKSKWSVTTADGTAQTWLIDSESGAISIRSVEGTTASVQEFFGGKEYTYTTDHQLTKTQSFEEESAEFCAEIENSEVDCEVFYKEQQSTIASMTEILTGSKHLCTSEDSESISATTISSDGNLSVGGFIVSMVNGSPSAIIDHAGNSIATINSFEDVEEVKLTGCDTSEEATYLDAIANVADSRRQLGEVDAEVMKAREMMDEIILDHISGDIEEEARRHLRDAVASPGGFFATSGSEQPCVLNHVPGGIRASTAFLKQFGAQSNINGWSFSYGTGSPNVAINYGSGGKFDSSKGSPLCQGMGNKKVHRYSKSNWCGSFSNREHTPCPKDGTWVDNKHLNNGNPRVQGVTTTINNYDWKTDGACRRHDHGIRFEYIKGGCRLGCQIDNDLNKKSTKNLSVQAVFGDTGCAQIPRWGCYTKGYFYSWRRNYFSGLGRCSWFYKKSSVFKERILLGATRYFYADKHGHHYGYYVPFRYCHSDKSNPFLPNTYATALSYKGKYPWWENDYKAFPYHPLTQDRAWDSTLGYWKYNPSGGGNTGGTGNDGIAGPGRPGRA